MMNNAQSKNTAIASIMEQKYQIKIKNTILRQIFKTEAGQRIVKDARKKDQKIVTDYIDFLKMSMYNKNIANG